MKVTSTITVEQRGIGKPDYTREVSSAIERKGFVLAYKQSLLIAGVVFSAVPSSFVWVRAPLAPGDTQHYINNITGIPFPYLVPQGYTLSLIAGGYGLTEDAIVWIYLDGFRAMIGGVLPGGSGYENTIVAISTALLDPAGLTPHIVDIQITNLGAGDLEGGVDYTGILEEVGSEPLPTVKIVRCKFCSYEELVPLETVRWICVKCGQLNMFYNLSKFRRST